MRLALTLGGAVLSFTSPTDAEGPYPWLDTVATLRMAAAAGDDSRFGAPESPSLRLQLDNDANQAVRLIGRPLRAPAEVFNDDGSSYFAGVISYIQYARKITIEIGT